MSERGNLQQELEAVLRAHGVAARNLYVVLNELHYSYCQFSLRFDDSMLDDFATLFKKIMYFAGFAHSPQVSGQVAAKCDAWGWVKHHARMYPDAPPDTSPNRRGVIGGKANAFHRAPIAMDRVKYALRWPTYLRVESVSLWQEVSTSHMTVFG